MGDKIRVSISAAILSLVALILPVAAQAEVKMTFFSHDMGSNFPHAFVTLDGKLDSTGEVVDADFGFTPPSVGPSILLGSVKGVVKAPPPKYVNNSNPHFTLTLNDAEYSKVMATITKWKNLPGKSYNLSKRNCVHFVADIARTMGLKTNADSRYFKKPRSFLNEVMELNQTRLARAK